MNERELSVLILASLLGMTTGFWQDSFGAGGFAFMVVLVLNKLR